MHTNSKLYCSDFEGCKWSGSKSECAHWTEDPSECCRECDDTSQRFGEVYVMSHTCPTCGSPASFFMPDYQQQQVIRAIAESSKDMSDDGKAVYATLQFDENGWWKSSRMMQSIANFLSEAKDTTGALRALLPFVVESWQWFETLEKPVFEQTAPPKDAPKDAHKDEFQEEIKAAEEAAAKLFTKYSVEYYDELEKCDAFRLRRAAFWKGMNVSKGW